MDVLEKGENRVCEIEIPHLPDRVFNVNLVPITPRTEPKTELMTQGAVVVFHDITRLKDLERIRQNFVANVSHELRTPLTAIKGYAETLLDGGINKSAISQFLLTIDRQANRLTKIVEDLLLLSKIESKEFHFSREKICLQELLDEAICTVIEWAQKKKITISKIDISDSLYILGDPYYLGQALINIIDNAIKYGRQGGIVEISAHEISGNEIMISIRDDGIGIPKEDLLRAFERFYRVDKGRSRELGGTGLGLSIVKHIVQAHGGQVWAESEVGKGTTFYLILPGVEKENP